MLFILCGIWYCNNMKKSKTFLFLSMFIFGTIGLFRKQIDLPSSVLAMSRGFIGALFILGFMKFKQMKVSFESIKKNLFPILLSGVFLGFNWILLFEAYEYTTVAIATLCYYMAPIIVIVVSFILFKENITKKKAICILFAIVGMILVSGVFDTKQGDIQFKGILLGLGAAVLYASVVLMNKQIKEINAYDKTVVQLSTAAIVLIPYILFTENVSGIQLDGLSFMMLVLVGIVHTGIAYALYFSSMKDLEAQTIALYSYIDPCVAIFLSAFVLREQLSLLGIVGAIIVLGSTLISEMEGK